MVKYNQRCFKCKNNFVLVSGRDRFPLCYDCQKNELSQEIKNKKMKELFDIPEEFYRENPFLRNVKIYYLKNNKLSEKQIEAFKKTVAKMKEDRNI